MKKILFITHEATATGAPKVLYLFLQWMQQNHPEVERHVVCLQAGGKLKEAFEQVAHAYHIFPTNKYQKKTFLEKVMTKLGWHTPKKSTVEVWQDLLVANQYDIIYANTIVTLPFANQMKERLPKAKLVCHVHEMKTIIQLVLLHQKINFSLVDHWIAVSTLVKKDLLDLSIPIDLIEIITEFSDIHSSVLKIPKNRVETIQIASSGIVHWRKGEDLFIQVARVLKKNYPKIDFQFNWYGQLNKNQEIIINADLEKLDLKNKVHFGGHTNNIYEAFSNTDLFLLTSREDPFPLVAIEAGAIGIPVICFDKATGIAEIVNKIQPFDVLDYLDVEAMAERIAFYYSNPLELKVIAEKSKIEYGIFTVEEQCKKIYSLLSIT